MKQFVLRHSGKWMFAVSAIAIMAALEAGPAMSQKVGTAAAVNPASIAKPRSGSERLINIGSDIIHNERISTSGQGSLQLVFIDSTSLSIGPNSDVTIDDFIYNPNTKTGKMAVTVGKGLLRFVGGQISHSSGATVTTTSATMGIRGGIALYNVDANQQTTVVHLFGKSTVNAGGGSQFIAQPGYYVQIGGPGATPTAPRPAPPGLIAAYNAQLQSKPGQTGGAAKGVASSKSGGNNNGDITGSIGGQQANQNWVGNPQSPQKGSAQPGPVVVLPPPVLPPPGPGGGGGGGGGAGGFTPPGLTGGLAPGLGGANPAGGPNPLGPGFSPLSHGKGKGN